MDDEKGKKAVDEVVQKEAQELTDGDLASVSGGKDPKGGAGTGRAEFSNLTIMKVVDKASPSLS